MRPTGREGQGNPVGDAVFAAAVADLHAGRDTQRLLRPQVAFEDVPGPRKLAPYSAAIAATVRAVGDQDLLDIAGGRLILLYDPEGQPGWAGQFRLIAYIRADVEPEIAADPLLGPVGWSWLTEALDARALGYAAPSGTVTRVVTEGFGGKQGEPPATGFELRASWSPAGAAPGPGPGQLDTPGLAGHVAAWCDALCAAAGLPPAAAGLAVMPTPRPRP